MKDQANISPEMNGHGKKRRIDGERRRRRGSGGVQARNGEEAQWGVPGAKRGGGGTVVVT